MQHIYCTIAARLKHHCSTYIVPLQHIYSTIAAHLQHHCSTFTAPLQHIYITIAAHLLHHCSTFTALLLSTKFRLILEEEKFQFLNWCYLFEGLIENGKVKKELNKTWQTILIILSQVVYLKYRQDILVLQHAAQFQHILFLSSSLRNLGVGFGFPKGNPNQKFLLGIVCITYVVV